MRAVSRLVSTPAPELVRGRSPDYSQALRCVKRDLRIRSYQDEILHGGLRNQRPVERIAMDGLQAVDSGNVNRPQGHYGRGEIAERNLPPGVRIASRPALDSRAGAAMASRTMLVSSG